MNNPAPSTRRRGLEGLLLALVCGGVLTAHAQAPDSSVSLPDPVVLVVKLVQADLLQPSTGIVIGQQPDGDSLVVINADFLATPGEIMVLDTGSDVFMDGVPASPVTVNAEEGLAILEVPGLTRPAASLTVNPPDMNHELRLAAFPPATDLAAGKEPLWLPVIVNGKRTGILQSLSEQDPLPNLDGPLLDLCGQWAGMVMATGTPSLVSAPGMRVVLNDELIRMAEAVGIPASRRECNEIAAINDLETYQSVTPTSQSGEAADTRTDSKSVASGLGDMILQRDALVFLASTVVSFLLLWVFLSRRTKKNKTKKKQRAREAQTVTFSADGMPTRVTRDHAEPFAPGKRPPGTSSWFRLEGTHADGRPLRGVVGVDERRFRVEVGRAGADLQLDGQGISRQHCVITGENGVMTITDLGSRNGTFINGVRCQKDEIFYLKPKDVILLGAAEVTVSLAPAKGFNP